MNPLTKIFRMLGKDLTLFYRDKKTFVLVFVAPIVILFILANIFNVSDTKDAIKGVTIGVCNLDSEPLALDTDVFNLMILEGNCMSEAQRLVSIGELRAAVVVPENFSRNIREGKGSELTTIIDNAKGQIAIVSSAAMKAFVSDLNEQIGTAFIEAAWVRLTELNDRLAFAQEQLEVADEYAQKIQERMPEIREKLDSVDLVMVRTQLIAFNSSLTEFQTSVGNSIQTLNTLSVLPEYNVSTFVPSLNVSLNTSELETLYTTSCIPTAIDNFTCKVLKQSLNQIGSLSDSLAYIETLNEMVGNATQEITQILNTTDSVVGDLSLVQSELHAFQDNISIIFGFLDDLIASEERLRNEINNVDVMITNYTTQIQTLQEEITVTRQELSEYTAKDPKNIIRAVTLHEQETFPNRKVLEFMIPGIIALILLFVTMFISSAMLVTEKRSGCMARNFLAPSSIFIFMIQKVIYLMLLAVVEIVCMLIVCSLLGISIHYSWALVGALLLSAFSFVSVGIFVGAYSKTENTALLSSLVLGLPMLFLSGLFFPFEIMPPVMRTIGAYLPLTLSVELLDQILIYGHGIVGDVALTLSGLSLAIFLLATLIVKKNPMAD